MANAKTSAELPPQEAAQLGGMTNPVEDVSADVAGDPPAWIGTDGKPLSVHVLMGRILQELPPIGKHQHNTQQNFDFRGHDDVLDALNPLLGKYGVFILPYVLDRETAHRTTGNNKTMYEVNLHVQFTFYGPGGDSVVASGWGEGTDMGDKATSKAMTMAMKYVIAEAFAISAGETVDPDSQTPEHTTAGASSGSAPQPKVDPWEEVKGQLERYVEDAGPWMTEAREKVYGKPFAELSREEKIEMGVGLRKVVASLESIYPTSEAVNAAVKEEGGLSGLATAVITAFNTAFDGAEIGGPDPFAPSIPF